MFGFHFLVWLLCVRGVRDTQCGFKLFSHQAARLLFCNQHVERWFVHVIIIIIIIIVINNSFEDLAVELVTFL